MKLAIKLSTQLATIALIAVSAQSSLAQVCAQDVECQQSKIEAMGENKGDMVLNDIKDLKNLLTRLTRDADAENEYVGSARALGRVLDVEMEAEALIRSGSASAVSIQGRTLNEIHQEILDIKNGYRAAGIQ